MKMERHVTEYRDKKINCNFKRGHKMFKPVGRPSSFKHNSKKLVEMKVPFEMYCSCDDA